jgi:hypothetical protein
MENILAAIIAAILGTAIGLAVLGVAPPRLLGDVVLAAICRYADWRLKRERRRA